MFNARAYSQRVGFTRCLIDGQVRVDNCQSETAVNTVDKLDSTQN